MSYYEAVADGIHMEIGRDRFTRYFPPCGICGTPVCTWKYIRGTRYVCQECRSELVRQNREERLCSGEKMRRLETAVKRISAVTAIEPYADAIGWVKQHLNKQGWFQSAEEIMVALELCRWKEKAYHQVHIFDYRIDFVLPRYKVVLEIDGKIYHGQEKKEKETLRDELIATKLGSGWEVIRIDTENINENVTKLLPAIEAVLRNRKKRLRLKCAQEFT